MLKKLIAILFLNILFVSNVNAGYGSGELKLSENAIYEFQRYIQGKLGKPEKFFISTDGKTTHWWYCPYSQCTPMGDTQEAKKCSRRAGGVECKTFAVRRSIKWDNGVDKKALKIKFKSKDSIQEIKDKLTALNFYGSSDVKETKPNTSNYIKKKYSLKDERPIALQWEGYSDLIAGTIKFDEKNYQGTLKLPLPNNDGTCNGSYTLQEGGNGVWQMTCTNNTGASGTLKWDGSGGVTGIGRDYKNKKLKFTVSKKS
tara:strand:+ start:515 stop:1285 length:771 start_codon:yes stop_codon:yes gene_type:complete